MNIDMTETNQQQTNQANNFNGDQNQLNCLNAQLLDQEGQRQDKQLLSDQQLNKNDPNIYNNYYQYLFALIGFAVGFGSFWRFPYLIYKNGGGAFLIPYFIALIFLGIPLLYLQTVVGQFHRCSQPFIFQKINKGLKFLGYSFICISFTSSYYYNLIMAYSYRYLLTAFSWQLPYKKESLLDNAYFQKQFLQKSQSIEDFGTINYPVWILYMVSIVICFFIVKHGVKSSGKIVVFTATIPYFFFLILLLRGLFLQGALDGLVYLFVPKFQKLLNMGIWVDAFVQVFYQISIACGTVINFSSMKRRREQFLLGIYIVPLSLVICGLLCAMTVFMYLGHFCLQQNIHFDDVTISGPQLSFNVFPKALAVLPLPNLWIFFFFAAMIFLGLDTQFGYLQTIYCCLKDEFKATKFKNVLTFKLSQQNCKYLVVFAMLIFSPLLASSAGIYYLQFFDYFVNSVPLSIGALIQIYVFVYLVPYDQLQSQIKKYRKQNTPKWIRYLLQSKLLVIMLSLNLIFALFSQIKLISSYSWNYYMFGWFLTIYSYVGSYIYYRKYNTSEWNLTFQEFEKQEQGQRSISFQLRQKDIVINQQTKRTIL